MASNFEEMSVGMGRDACYMIGRALSYPPDQAVADSNGRNGDRQNSAERPLCGVASAGMKPAGITTKDYFGDGSHPCIKRGRIRLVGREMA